MEFDAEDIAKGTELVPADIETGKYNQIIGHGRSAHYLHREAEEYGVDRKKVANTYNRMSEMLDPENPHYGSVHDGWADFPKDDELDEAARLLSKGESIEKSATSAMLGRILERGSASGMEFQY